MRRADEESSGETPIFTSTSRERGGVPWYTGIALFVLIVAVLVAGRDRSLVVVGFFSCGWSSSPLFGSPPDREPSGRR
jgi:hypothetical protein